jgi:hypothetical protein
MSLVFNSQARAVRQVIEPRCIEVIAVPSNKQLQLTVESVTPFAGQRARHFRLPLS